MSKTKAMTLRLPADQAQELESVAAVDRVSLSQSVRQAIDAHIENRRRDKGFQDRLEQLISDNRAVFEVLAGGDAPSSLAQLPDPGKTKV